MTRFLITSAQGGSVFLFIVFMIELMRFFYGK